MKAPEPRRAADARDAVLARIRDALADAPLAIPVPRDYERALPAGTAIVGLFAERVSDYRATNGIDAPIHEVDWTAVWWRKPPATVTGDGLG